MTRSSSILLRIKLLLLTTIASACLLSPEASAATTKEKPNILIFLVDDMGWQDTSVPFYYKEGNPVVTKLNKFYKTPNMEKLAGQGMKFTNAYAAPVCSPSRTSLITGQHPLRHRVTTWTALDGAALNDEVDCKSMQGPSTWSRGGINPKMPATLPRLMKSAGYRPIIVGKGHFGPNNLPIHDPKSLGFEKTFASSGLGGPGSYRADLNFQEQRPNQQVPGMEKYWLKGANPDPEKNKQNFLTSALTTEMEREIDESLDAKKPFFALMSHYAVHSTHKAPDPNCDRNTYAVLPSQQGISVQPELLKNFATLIEGMDLSLGRLIDHLKEKGVAKKTILIFLSDNGGDAPIQQSYNGNIDWISQVGAIAPLRGRKGSRFEGGSRVPLIIAWAEPDPNEPIQQQWPICQNSVNHDIVAIWDLLPTLCHISGQRPPASSDGFDLTPYLKGEKGEKSYHRPQSIIQHFPHSHTYARFYSSLREGDWKVIYNYMDDYSLGKYPWELFNLKDDISESVNLAKDPAFRPVLDRLANKLILELKKSKAQFPTLTNPSAPKKKGERPSIGEAKIRSPKECDASSPR